MKKITSIILILVLLISAAGCKDKDTEIAKSQFTYEVTDDIKDEDYIVNIDTLTTEPPTEAPTEPVQVIVLAEDPTEPPTEPEVTEPEPTDPLFEATEIIMYTNSYVNIRSSWSTKSEKLGTLSRGTEINVIGIGKSDTEASDWVRIKINIDNDEDPEEVYLYKSYVSDTKPSSGGSGNGSGSSGSGSGSSGSGSGSSGSGSGSSGSGSGSSGSGNSYENDDLYSVDFPLKPAEPTGGGSTDHNDVSGETDWSYEEDTSHITPENGYGMG